VPFKVTPISPKRHLKVSTKNTFPHHSHNKTVVTKEEYEKMLSNDINLYGELLHWHKQMVVNYEVEHGLEPTLDQL
jgi:hypothetical protein